MRTALRQVQEELGADAVILSTQSERDRVTVIAALDYDAALVPSAADNMEKFPASGGAAPMGSSSAQLLARASGQQKAAPAKKSYSAPSSSHFISNDDFDLTEASAEELADFNPNEPEITAASGSGEGLQRLERELAYLHRMLAERLPEVSAALRPEHVQASVLQDIGVDAALVQRIQATTMTEKGIAPDHDLLAELAKRIPVTLPHGSKVRAIALVGPTGVGKTTTAAKLAARHLMRHPGSNVRFVATDTYRIGAREQLQTFARLLGTTVEVADDPQVLKTLIQTEEPTDLVIVDTPGIGPRDKELAEQLPVLGDMEGLHVILCLPASTHPVEQRRIIGRYAESKPDGMILTKLDETYQLGAALSVAIERSLPVLWVTDGQRVPQDMHRLDAKSLVARALASREATDDSKPILSQPTPAEVTNA